MKKLSLTSKVLLGMGLGIAVGLLINLTGLNANSFINSYIIGFFAIIGKLFITALKMLVVPLVLFSLITGVLGIGDIKELGRVGFKTFALYILTTAIAISTAVFIAATLHIGEGANLSTTSTFHAKEAPPVSEVLINIIPSNVIDAMAQGNMLQIIFFAILVGISILMVGVKAKPLVELIEISNEVMMKMVTIIMATAPKTPGIPNIRIFFQSNSLIFAAVIL